MTSQSAFQELRPLCVQLSRIAFLPSESFDPQSARLLDSLKTLDSKLATFADESFSQNLAEYVFVPIASLLKHNGLGDSQTEYVLRLLSQLLRLSWKARGTFAKELAGQLLPLLTFLIGQDRENSNLNQKSAEFRGAGCEALYRLFTSIREQSYKSEFFSSANPNSLSILGHCITILLKILEGTPEEPKIQLQSLETLRILYQDIIGDGEILSFVLPGTVSSFVRVLVAPGVKVHYKVVVKTLQFLGITLQTVYDDLSLNIRRDRFTDVNKLIAFKEKNPEWHTNTLIDMPMEKHSQHRTLSWLSGTSAQVKRALEGFIPKLLKRQNSEINHALAVFVCNLLASCKNSLCCCEALFISTLVSIRQDPKNLLGGHIDILRGVIEQYTLRIGDIIRFESTEELQSFSYALDVLNQHDFKEDFSFVKDIGVKVLDVLEFDILQKNSKYNSSKILEQSSNVILAGNLEAEIAGSYNTIGLLPTVSKELENALGGLLIATGRLLNQEASLDVLIESLLSEQVCATITRKTLALWLSTWELKGLYQNRPLDFSLTDFLDVTQDDEYNYGPCYNMLEFCNGLAQEVTMAREGRALSAQEETAMSTVLFSIESACSIMHTEFTPELIDYLYIVVENLASSSSVVRHFAQSCALTISKELYDNSVKEMILSNVDYLVDSISTRLNLGMTERISTVFAVICKIAGYETIETFKDVIETIFKLIDYYHGYSDLCIQFFQLFEVIVTEMGKKFMSTDNLSKLDDCHLAINAYAPWGMTNLQQLLSILDKPVCENEQLDEQEPPDFQKYFDSKIEEVDSDDEEFPEEEEAPAEASTAGGKWSSPIPLASYRILLQIFNYGDRLLTHPSKQLRVQILHVMELIIPMLSTQYDSLLPQVANTWDTLVYCTLDADYTIAKPACTCLKQLIHYAGDFVAKRFFELWDCWCKKSKLLREVRFGNKSENMSFQVSTRRKFPPVTKDALLALAGLLLEGIAVTELMLPDTTLKDIVCCCLQILPMEVVSQKSLVLGDVVWVLCHAQ